MYAIPKDMLGAAAARSTDAFPELGATDAGNVYRVNQSGLRTPFGDATEDVLVRGYADEQQQQTSPPSGPADGGMFGSVLGRIGQVAGNVGNAVLRTLPGVAPIEDAFGMVQGARTAYEGYQRAQQGQLGFFSGANPVQSVEQAAQGITGQRTFSSQDFGFARLLPEGSRAREAVGNVEQTLTDPITLASLGAGAPVRAAIGAGAIGAEAAGQAAESLIPSNAPDWLKQYGPSAARVAGGIAAGVYGAKAATGTKFPVGMSVEEATVRPPEVPPVEPSLAPPTASERLFGLNEPVQGISRADEALNTLKRTVGIGVPENDLATPIMRERQRVQQVVSSQAARLGSIAADVTRVFPTDKMGRIAGLPGTPTIQDVAARLPQYEKYLAEPQLSAMQRLQQEVAPFTQALTEQGVDIASRADVQPGGFYLPRGNAAIEGADAPLKVGTGRGGAGGKKGFERGATFDSMAQGIDAGYQYAKFRDALQSYAQDAGNRAIDAWAAQSFKNTGLGEGVKERLMRQQPDLAAEWQDVNAGIASVRAKLATAEARAGLAGGKADELDAALAEVVRAQPEGGARPLARIPTALKNLKAEAQDTFLGEAPREYAPPPSDAQAGVRESNRAFGLGMDKVVQQLDELVPEGTERIRFLDTAIARSERRLDALAQRGGKYTQQADDLRSELDTLRDHLSGIAPEYRRAVERAMQTPREQGGIGFSGLNGTTFPDEVANVANKYLASERRATGQGTGVLNAVDAFNGLLRGIRATADISFTGIQGLLGAVQHPGQYAKAMKVAFQSMGDEAAFGKYVTLFDDAARAAGRPDSVAWNAVGNRLGGESTEFQIGQGLKRVGPAIMNAPIIKQSNRAFGVFGDTLRLGSNDALYAARQSAGKAVGPAEMADIAKFSNLMTGWSSRRFLGDAGSIVEFAPRFFQSQLDLVGNALTSGSITGQESRAALAKLVGIGSLITIAANSARGYDTDFNPASPNFMRIRNVAGTDVSLFGPWDSLLRGITSAMKGDFTYIARSKASPLVALAWDEISGKSFTGQDTRTPEYLLRSLLPFGLAQIGQPGETVGGTAIGLTGVKATPLSPTDRVQMGEYAQLPPEQAFKAIPAEAWRLTVENAPAEMRSEFGNSDETAGAWYQRKVAEYVAGWRARGAPPGEAERLAEQSIQRHPVYGAYLNARNYLENQWYQTNPALGRERQNAEMQKTSADRRNLPTKIQRAIMQAAGR